MQYYDFVWAMSCENVPSGICGRRRPRSDCASAQSDQCLHSPLTKLFDTTKCMGGEQRPGGYSAYALDDLNLRISRMFEDTFTHGAVHIENRISEILAG